MFNMFKKSSSKFDSKSKYESEAASASENLSFDFIKNNTAIKPVVSNEKANKMFVKASQMIDEYFKDDVVELFSEAPLFLKNKFVLHAFALSGSLDNVNWGDITDFIFGNPIPYDYNIDLPAIIVSIDDLKYLDSMMFMSLKDIKPFHKSNCKSCGNDFELYYGEIKFYIHNNLYIPRKCQSCRKNK